LRINPGEATAHHLLALCLSGAGDFTNAIPHYRLALALRLDSASLRHRLGTALMATGGFAEAVAHLAAAVRMQPGNFALRQSWALALQQHQQIREALAQYREALRLQPDSPEVLNNLGWLLATQRDPALRDGAEAVRLAERACALTGRSQPLLLGTLAAAYAEARRFDEAVRTGEEAARLAEAAGQTDLARKNQELVASYRAGKPYHEGTE
jgi:Tfp pilus assembly protein PilF